MKRLVHLTMAVFNNFVEDEIFTRAAALAFYTVFSLTPLSVLFVVFLSTLDLNLQQELVGEVQSLIGSEAAGLFESVMMAAKNRPDLSTLSGWVGIGTLLFSASLIFAQIQTTLNMIFNTSSGSLGSHESWWATAKDVVMDRLVSIGVLLAFVFLAIVSLFVSSSIYYFVGRGDVWWTQLINEGFSLLIFTVLFAIIFKWMPDRSIKFSNGLLGGLITGVLFVIGKFAIGFYMGQSALGSAYGAAGSLAILLVWVYYSGLVMFLGAEVSYVALLEREPMPPESKDPG